MPETGSGGICDVVVVGAGPSALTVLQAAGEAGLSALAIEKGPLCGALTRHPVNMRWFSTADKLELAGFPLVCEDKNPTRLEYLKYCQAFVRYFRLRVVTYREVVGLVREGTEWVVTAKDMFGRASTWRAYHVVIATGFYDNPRPLNVPGEDLPKVTHRYEEPCLYADQDVLVVGAGSSAAETALDIWRYGARTTVLMRGERFTTKYWIEPDIENRIREGAIACYRNAEILEIRPDDVLIRDDRGHEVTLPNDFVLAMTGYVPDTSLLAQAGAEIDSATGKPRLTDGLETMAPGVYAAGTLIAGLESNSVFVENSREHGARIVTDILAKRKAV